MLALTTGEAIAIVAIFAPLLLGVLTFAFKAKILKEVNTKLEPLENKVLQMDKDLTLITAALENLTKTIDRGQDRLEKLIEEKDRSNKENFKLIYDKIDKKADKAAV
jgi:septal ring factor EnvC (AmiA/AmiB activator)